MVLREVSVGGGGRVLGPLCPVPITSVVHAAPGCPDLQSERFAAATPHPFILFPFLVYLTEAIFVLLQLM